MFLGDTVYVVCLCVYLSVKLAGSSMRARCRPMVPSRHPTSPASTRATPSVTTCFTAEKTSVSSSTFHTSTLKASGPGQCLKHTHTVRRNLRAPNVRYVDFCSFLLVPLIRIIRCNMEVFIFCSKADGWLA